MFQIFDVDFYMKRNGKVPVRDFLYTLEPKLRAKAFKDIELLRIMGDELREPYVKSVKGKNYKRRVKL